jgi:hypothetical protein
MSELQRPTEQKEKDLRTLADRLGGRKDFGSRMSAEDAKLIERVMGSKLGGKVNNDGRIDPEERKAILALQSKDTHYSKSLTKGGISPSFLYSQLRDELVEDYKANNSVGNKSAEFTRALENYNARLKELTSWKEREFSGDNVFKGFSLEDPTLTGAPKSLAEIKERSAALERRAQELWSITGEAEKFFKEEIAKRQGVADLQITKRSETDSAAVVPESPAGDKSQQDNNSLASVEQRPVVSPPLPTGEVSNYVNEADKSYKAISIAGFTPKIGDLIAHQPLLDALSPFIERRDGSSVTAENNSTLRLVDADGLVRKLVVDNDRLHSGSVSEYVNELVGKITGKISR